MTPFENAPSTDGLRLLVGLPALNEERTIAEVLARVPRNIPGISEVTLLVVDDGSSDETASRARNCGAQVISHPTNLGVGAAFHSIVREALRQRSDILVTLDSDGQFNPEDIPKLIAPLQSSAAQVVTASRFADKSLVPTMPLVKKWGNRRVAAIISGLTGKQLLDVSCGFRAYCREALLRLTVYHAFTYTHETLLDLASKRVSILELPLVVRGTREFGKSRVASSVLRYGFRTSTIIIRFYRDNKPLTLCLLLALPVGAVALGLGLLSFYFWFTTGSWLKWAAFTGAAAGAVTVMLGFFGFMADIVVRLRKNQEEILYWLRAGLAVPSSANDASKRA